MNTQTFVPSTHPIDVAIGVLAFLRSAIRCGEDLSEQEFESIQNTINDLKSYKDIQQPSIPGLPEGMQIKRIYERHGIGVMCELEPKSFTCTKI